MLYISACDRAWNAWAADNADPKDEQAKASFQAGWYAMYGHLTERTTAFVPVRSVM